MPLVGSGGTSMYFDLITIPHLLDLLLLSDQDETLTDMGDL